MTFKKNVLLVLVALCFHLAYAQPIPLDTAVHTGKLSNGFTYYIRHNEEPKNRVILYLVNNVGSTLEDEDQQGLAHFMEHMNFNGTKHFPKNELVNYLQKSGVRFGADLNAYTSFDETVYQLPIPTDDSSILSNGFQIMRDWAAEALLDPVEIDKERGVVLEEKRLGRGAQERMQRQYWPVLLNHSRYAERLPIGQEDILVHFTPQTISRFFHDWYRPDLQALVVVGDIDPVKTEELVKKLFGDLVNPPGEKTRTKYSVPLQGDNHFIAVTDKEMPYAQIQLMIKHDKNELVTEADYIQSIRQELFNQMTDQRFEELSQQPGIPYISAGAYIGDFLSNLDVFSFSITAKEGKFKEGFQKGWREIERIRRFGFTAGELDRAKQNYLRRMETSYKEKDKTNSNSLVREYVSLFLNHEASPGIAWEYNFAKDKLPAIGIVDINKLAAEYIKESNRDILVLAPDKQKNELPDSAALQSWLSEINAENLTVYKDLTVDKPLIAQALNPGKILKEQRIPEIGVTELTLSNGIRVLCKPTDFKNDEILFGAFSAGGTSLYPDKEFQSAANASNIMNAFGIGDFDAPALNKKLSGKNIFVQPFIADRSEGFNGFSSPQDLETALQLVHLYFTAPRKDKTVFDNIISNSKDFIANRSNNPNAVFGDTINYFLHNYNFRSKPSTVKTLDEVNLDKVYSIYRDRFADASGFSFIFVGSFSIDSLRPLLEKYLANLPSLNRHTQAKNLHIHTPQGVYMKKVFKGTENKASVRMVFSGDYHFDPVTNMQFNALKEVLQIKIIQHLREDESEVYSPSVSFDAHKYPDANYSFTVSFGCAPKNAEHLMEDIDKEIAAVRDHGPVPEDLEKFKAEYKRTHETQIRDNGYWLSYLTFQYENGEEPLNVMNYSNRLESVTAKQVQDAAKKYLNGKNRIAFVLLPEK